MVIKINMKGKVTRISIIFLVSIILCCVIVNSGIQKGLFAIIVLGIMLLILIKSFLESFYNFMRIEGQVVVIRRLFRGTTEITKDEISGYLVGSARNTSYVEVYYNDSCYKFAQGGTENYDYLLEFLENNSKRIGPVERAGG